MIVKLHHRKFFLPFKLYQRKASFFITTPIFYVNAAPHIGHVYTALLADAQSRFQRLLGDSNILFCTGTDEHGLKIQQAAEATGRKPFDFCNEMSSKFQEAFAAFQIEPHDFIRTTEERHKKAVISFWERLKNNGHIYKGKYAGWYCVSEESFIPSSQIKEIKLKDGTTRKVSSESLHPLEWMEEENFMFRLSSFQNELCKWLKNSEIIKPQVFQKIALQHLEKDLTDISISRNRSRLQWGIPVPGDESQTIYVWVDALVNYLTTAGYPNDNFTWPPSYHVLGKEILKFHAIYWPAFLMAANLELPQRLIIHSHWTVGHQKMSKSRGNVVDPIDQMQKYSSDGLRYFLLREGVPHSDGSYSDDKVTNFLNAELANTFGNLLSRCISPALNPDHMFPSFDLDTFSRCRSEGHDLVKMVEELPSIVKSHFLEFNFYHGLEAIMATLRQANLFVEVEKPWESKKDLLKRPHLDTVIYVALETLRVCGILMQPIVPQLSNHLLSKLGIPHECRMWYDAERSFLSIKGKPNKWEGNHLASQTCVLFQRIKDERVAYVKNKRIQSTK